MSHAQLMAELKQTMPKMAAGYRTLKDTLRADSALDAKTKSLTALAIAVSRRSEETSRLALDQALAAGATRSEVTEAIGMAVFMGGEPAAFDGDKVFEAYTD